jgi:hypothetical protein
MKGDIMCMKKLAGIIVEPNLPYDLLNMMSLLYQNSLASPWPLLTFIILKERWLLGRGS